MKKSILTTVFFLATLFAMAQTQFEQGMNKAFELWKTGNTTEASAMFERIASILEPPQDEPYIAIDGTKLSTKRVKEVLSKNEENY